MPPTYTPGVCNIGKKEINKRYTFGFVMLALTFFYAQYVHGIQAPIIPRLFTIIPASLAAVGFLQAYYHFCAYFGLKGLLSLEGDHPTDTPLQADIRRKDRKKAWDIIDMSLGMGAFVTILVCLW